MNVMIFSKYMNTPIEIKSKNEQGAMVFEFHGELDETNADKTFTDIYSSIGDFKSKKIILNLVELKYLNSKSIGYIADIFSNLEDVGSKMALSNILPEVHDTLELVGILQIIPAFASEQEAVASFASA